MAHKNSALDKRKAVEVGQIVNHAEEKRPRIENNRALFGDEVFDRVLGNEKMVSN